MVTERTQELEKEKHRSEELLLNILPEEVAEELKVNGRAAAHRFEHSTVLFSDFKGFTTFSSNMDSDTLVSELHHYFGLFDALCDAHGLEKIKTIGDAYMCAAGFHSPRRRMRWMRCSWPSVCWRRWNTATMNAGRKAFRNGPSASACTADRWWPAWWANASSPTTSGATR